MFWNLLLKECVIGLEIAGGIKSFGALASRELGLNRFMERCLSDSIDPLN